MIKDMIPATRVIPIESHAAATGCGDCVHDELRGPVCRSLLAQPCAAPQFSGPGSEVQRLMAALAPVLQGDTANDAVDQAAAPKLGGASLVRALHVRPGEVELQLSIGANCGGALLADSAFQTLRSLLPDTDIYVDLAR